MNSKRFKSVYIKKLFPNRLTDPILPRIPYISKRMNEYFDRSSERSEFIRSKSYKNPQKISEVSRERALKADESRIEGLKKRVDWKDFLLHSLPKTFHQRSKKKSRLKVVIPMLNNNR